MKILRTDNFGKDYIPDKIIAVSLTDEMAERIVKLLNDDGGEYSEDFYSVVADDYEVKSTLTLP